MKIKTLVGVGALLLTAIGIAQEQNEIAPPSGWETWNLTDSCTSAREIFDLKNKPQAVIGEHELAASADNVKVAAEALLRQLRRFTVSKSEQAQSRRQSAG